MPFFHIFLCKVFFANFFLILRHFHNEIYMRLKKLRLRCLILFIYLSSIFKLINLIQFKIYHEEDGRGRPSDVDYKQLKALVEANPRTTIRELSIELDVSL